MKPEEHLRQTLIPSSETMHVGMSSIMTTDGNYKLYWQNGYNSSDFESCPQEAIADLDFAYDSNSGSFVDAKNI